MKSKYFKYILFVFVLVFSFDNYLHADNFGKTILAIYKSSDGYTEDSNPIKWFFEPEIKKLGLNVKYHDFLKGLPDAKLLNDTRAIITWYNSGVVKKKQAGIEYAAFLESAVDKGIKLIILNSFGAYGYEDGKETKWDLIQHINPLYKKMGFIFKGFWTNDPKLLMIAYTDPGIVSGKEKQDAAKSAHYQQIVPVRNDVTSHLIIRRTDRVNGIGDGNSSVILTSGSGGFALEQYVIRGSDLMIDPVKFLHNSLFYDDSVQDVGIIVGDIDRKEPITKTIEYACKYAKIKIELLDPSVCSGMIPNDLFKYEVLLLALKSSEEMSGSLIGDYVASGGHAIFLRYADLNDEYKKLLGIVEYKNNETYFEKGFDIDPGFFMNVLPLTGSEIDLSIKKAKLNNVKIIASISEPEFKKDYPILWEKKAGKGKILYWNTNLLLVGKRFRGAIIQSIHYIYDGFVSGMANIGMIMIDDFPAPLWNLNYKDYRRKYYNDLLQKETDNINIKEIKQIIKNIDKYESITDTDYIKIIWVKDILAFQNKFGLKYSSFLIFNYNRNTGLKKGEDEYPVDDFYLAADSLPVEMCKVALENGWELGLHGYNHMSLTVKQPEYYASVPWADMNAMVKSLSIAHDEWINLLSAEFLPFSYVAPHNIIDNTGIAALAKSFPSIRVLCTVYIGKEGESEQEFEWTEDNKFFQMPRLTSGYYLPNTDRFTFYDGVHNFGIISHFIHPDDVFDVSRSSGFSGWAWMKSEFDKELTTVKTYFPWIRWMSVKDAFNEFQFYNNTNLRIKKTGKTIIIESSDGSDKYLYFRLRLGKGQTVKSAYNCAIVYADKKSSDIIFKTNEHISKIYLK